MVQRQGLDSNKIRLAQSELALRSVRDETRLSTLSFVPSPRGEGPYTIRFCLVSNQTIRRLDNHSDGGVASNALEDRVNAYRRVLLDHRYRTKRV
jgi:hypothetical protein